MHLGKTLSGRCQPPQGTQDDVCDYVLPRGHPTWNIGPRIYSQSQQRDHMQPRLLPDLPRSWTGCAGVPKPPSAALAALLCGGSLLRCGSPLRWVSPLRSSVQPCTLTALLPGRTGHQQAPKVTRSSHRLTEFQAGSMCLGSCRKWPHFFVPQG